MLNYDDLVRSAEKMNALKEKNKSICVQNADTFGVGKYKKHAELSNSFPEDYGSNGEEKNLKVKKYTLIIEINHIISHAFHDFFKIARIAKLHHSK